MKPGEYRNCKTMFELRKLSFSGLDKIMKQIHEEMVAEGLMDK